MEQDKDFGTQESAQAEIDRLKALRPVLHIRPGLMLAVVKGCNKWLVCICDEYYGHAVATLQVDGSFE